MADPFDDLAQRLIVTSAPQSIEPQKTRKATEVALTGVQQITKPFQEQALTEALLPGREKVLKEQARIGEEIGREYSLQPERLGLMRTFGFGNEKLWADEFLKLDAKENRQDLQPEEIERKRELSSLLQSRDTSAWSTLKRREVLQLKALEAAAKGKTSTAQQVKFVLDQKKALRETGPRYLKQMLDYASKKGAVLTLDSRNIMGQLPHDYSEELKENELGKGAGMMNSMTAFLTENPQELYSNVIGSIKQKYEKAIIDFNSQLEEAIETGDKERENQLIAGGKVLGASFIVELGKLRQQKVLSDLKSGKEQRLNERIGQAVFNEVLRSVDENGEVNPGIFKNPKAGYRRFARDHGIVANDVFRFSIPEFEETYNNDIQGIADDITKSIFDKFFKTDIRRADKIKKLINDELIKDRDFRKIEGLLSEEDKALLKTIKSELGIR
jgi:hypothetical protein